MARFTAKLYLKNTRQRTYKKPVVSEEERKSLKLVPKSFKFEQISIDGTALSCRIDASEWVKIKHLMRSVEDHSKWDRPKLLGWLVKEGKEEEVKEILNIKD